MRFLKRRVPTAFKQFPRSQINTAVWPFGSNGALSINGTTVHLAAGSVKDYSSVSIINGGQLIIDQGNAWTILGCKGNFTVDVTSSILAKKGPLPNGTFTATAPDGTVLSYTTNDNSGGNADGGNGGPQGGGGGGGGQENSTNGDVPDPGDGGKGGDGGTPTNPDTSPGPGPTLPYGASGGSGPDVDGGSDDGYGGGGAGGSVGYHGQGLYIKVAGTISILGTIDASGSTGGNGGNGGQGSGGNGFGGSGAGGGGGGDGGKVVIRYKAGSNPSAQVLVALGSGGARGLAGFGSTSSGTDGSDGTSGILGTKDIASY